MSLDTAFLHPDPANLFDQKISNAHLRVVVEVHTPDSGGMAIQCVCALASVCIPHLECSVCGATDDDVVRHLRGPDPSCVSH